MLTEADRRLRLTARIGLFEAYRRHGESAWVQATGASMRPLIAPEDWLLVEFGPVDPRMGDVVLFRGTDQLVAHRVVARRGRQLLTKGDAASACDRPMAVTEVLGVVRARRRRPGCRTWTVGLSGPAARMLARLSLLGGIRTEAWSRRPT